MSPYYKYEFVSPQSIFSTVKEELNSLFESGMANDLLFPKWTDDCLKRLGRATYQLKPALMILDDFTATLPEDFYSVREAWLCVSESAEAAAASSVYFVEQETINKMDALDPDSCAVETCSDIPEQINVVLKKTRQLIATFSKHYLLKPGNISVSKHCSLDCMNYGSTSPDSFDIRDGKFVTNFRTGNVFMVYYSTDMDCDGNQLVPDNFRVKKFIELYLVYKVWKYIADNTPDEGLANRAKKESIDAKQMADEAAIIAETEIKKETIYKKAERLYKQSQRLNRFNIN